MSGAVASTQAAATTATTDARWVLHGDLAAAVVSPVPSSFRPLAHAALLATIHQSVDILPARFGEILPDEESVRGLLAGRRSALLDDLGRLRGTAEMGLRIELLPGDCPNFRVNENGTVPFDATGCVPPEPVFAAPRAPAATSPTQYLALRRRKYQRQDCLQQRAQRVIEDCLQAMKGLYRDWRRLAAGRPALVRLAFLVERSGWAGFEQRLASIRAEQTGERCTLVGPWPPYSFLGAGGRLDVV